MNGRRAGAAGAVLGLLLGVGLGCGRPRPAELRIGYLPPLTGELAVIGTSHLEGAELAVARVNAAGGITVGGRRHRVVLVSEDTGNDPEEALRLAQRMINQLGIAVLVAPMSSETAVPVAAQAERARMPTIVAGASHPEVTAGKRFVFRTTFTDHDQGRAMARFAVEDLGARRAAVLYDDATVYSHDLAEIFALALAEAGGEVVATASYAGSAAGVDADYRPELRALAEHDPEVLFLPNYPLAVSRQVLQAREVGLDAVFLGSDSWSDKMAADAPELQGAYFTRHWHPGVDIPESRAFVEEFRRELGHPPLTSAALSYEALNLLFAVLDGLESLDGERIRQALAEVDDYRGVTGRISFRDGGDSRKDVVILKIEDGRRRFHKLFPPER